MRIGLAVDGQAEVAALPALRPSLEAASGNVFIGPVYVPVNGNVPPAAIAAECHSRSGILLAKRIDLFLLLLDRETNQMCCGDLAADIERELTRRLPVGAAVVVKNQMFENWLLADVDALRASPARFRVSNALAQRVQPNKADNLDALREIRAAVAQGSYDKVADAKRIL